MKTKRIMILGSRESGKTLLANRLNGVGTPPKRTPHIVYGKNTLDVPGSYVESNDMHKHLIAAQQDAYCMLMLCDPMACKRCYPPGFSKVFRIPVLGVITKADLGAGRMEKCHAELESAGVQKPYYEISVLTGQGMDALMDRIEAIKAERLLKKGGCR